MTPALQHDFHIAAWLDLQFTSHNLYSLLLRPEGHIKLGQNHRQLTAGVSGDSSMTLSTTLLVGENFDSQLDWMLGVLKAAITALVQLLVVLLVDSTVHKNMIAES